MNSAANLKAAAVLSARNSILLFTAILSGCGSSSATPPPATQPLTSRADVLALVTGNTYFLDAMNGNDETGDGSSGKPWKSLAKAQSTAQEGDAVILRSGSYGEFNDDAYASSHDKWTVYINEEGATPEFTNVYFNHSHSPSFSYKLVFYGIKIAPSWVSPGSADPQDLNSTGSTYNKSASPIIIGYRNSIRFYNCEIVGTNKHLTTEAAYFTAVDDIIIERCHIHRISEGIVYVGSNNLQIRYNYIHEITSSFFKDGGGNSNITIEGNHAHDANWNTSEAYCPRAEGQTYHGSMVVIRSNNTAIRNNLLHDGGISSGMMFYSDGEAAYKSVQIENNLLYNPKAIAIILKNIGNDITIRNNTIIGFKTSTSYYAAFWASTAASGYDASGLFLYNNVFVGAASLESFKPYMTINNNILWNASTESGSLAQEDFAGTGTRLIMPTGPANYFESGFFNGPLSIFTDGTDEILDLTLATGSEGINFGDPDHQPSDSLGSLDANSQFIVPNGPVRDAVHHSAGCYEPL